MSRAGSTLPNGRGSLREVRKLLFLISKAKPGFIFAYAKGSGKNSSAAACPARTADSIVEGQPVAP